VYLVKNISPTFNPLKTSIHKSFSFYTPNCKSFTGIPEPRTLHPKLQNLDPQLQTFNPKSSLRWGQRRLHSSSSSFSVILVFFSTLSVPKGGSLVDVCLYVVVLGPGITVLTDVCIRGLTERVESRFSGVL
jgi:hypothetical protein